MFDKGRLLYVDTYEDGIKINRKWYDRAGKLEFEQNYPKEYGIPR